MIHGDDNVPRPRTSNSDNGPKTERHLLASGLLKPQHHSDALLCSLIAFLPYDSCSDGVLRGSTDDVVVAPLRAVLRLWTHFGISARLSIRVISQHVQEQKYFIATRDSSGSVTSIPETQWDSIVAAVTSSDFATEAASTSTQNTSALLVPRLRQWVEREQQRDRYYHAQTSSQGPTVADEEEVPVVALSAAEMLSRYRRKLDAELDLKLASRQSKTVKVPAPPPRRSDDTVADAFIFMRPPMKPPKREEPVVQASGRDAISCESLMDLRELDEEASGSQVVLILRPSMYQRLAVRIFNTKCTAPESHPPQSASPELMTSGENEEFIALPSATPNRTLMGDHAPLQPTAPRSHPFDTLFGMGGVASNVMVPPELTDATPNERLLLQDELVCALIARYHGFLRAYSDTVREIRQEVVAKDIVDWSLGPNDGFFFERLEELMAYAKRRLRCSDIIHPPNDFLTDPIGGGFIAVALRNATDSDTLDAIESFGLSLPWKVAKLLAQMPELQTAVPRSFERSHLRSPMVAAHPQLTKMPDPFCIAATDAAVCEPARNSPAAIEDVREENKYITSAVTERNAASTAADVDKIVAHFAAKNAHVNRSVRRSLVSHDADASSRIPISPTKAQRTQKDAASSLLSRGSIVTPVDVVPHLPLAPPTTTPPGIDNFINEKPRLNSWDASFHIAVSEALHVLPTYRAVFDILISGGKTPHSVDFDSGLCRLAVELLLRSLDVPDAVSALADTLDNAARQLHHVAAKQVSKYVSDLDEILASAEWCIALLLHTRVGSWECDQLVRGIELSSSNTGASWSVALERRVVSSLIQLASLLPRHYPVDRSVRVQYIAMKARTVLRRGSLWASSAMVRSVLLSTPMRRQFVMPSDWLMNARYTVLDAAYLDLSEWTTQCIDYYIRPQLQVSLLMPFGFNTLLQPSKDNDVGLPCVVDVARAHGGSAKTLIALLRAALDSVQHVFADALRRLDRLSDRVLHARSEEADTVMHERVFESSRNLLIETCMAALVEVPDPWDVEHWLGELLLAEDFDAATENATTTMIEVLCGWMHPDALLHGVSVSISMAERLWQFCVSLLRRGPGLRELARDRARAALDIFQKYLSVSHPVVPSNSSEWLTWNPFRVLSSAVRPREGDSAAVLLAIRSWSRQRYAMNRTEHAKALLAAVHLQRREAARLSSQAQIDGVDINADEALESCFSLMYLCVLLTDLAFWLSEADRTGHTSPTEVKDVMSLLLHCCKSFASSHRLTMKISKAAAKHWRLRSTSDVLQMASLQSGGDNFSLQPPETALFHPPDIANLIVKRLVELFMVVISDAGGDAAQLSPESTVERRAQIATNTVLASWCAAHEDVNTTSGSWATTDNLSRTHSLEEARRGWLSVLSKTIVSTPQAKAAVDWALRHLCLSLDATSMISSVMLDKIFTALFFFDPVSLATRYNLKALLSLFIHILESLDQLGTRRRLLISCSSLMPSTVPVVVGQWLCLTGGPGYTSRIEMYAAKLATVLVASVQHMHVGVGHVLPHWAVRVNAIAGDTIMADSIPGLTCSVLSALWSAAEGPSKERRAAIGEYFRASRSLIDREEAIPFFILGAPRDALYNDLGESRAVIEKWIHFALGMAHGHADRVREFARDGARKSGPCPQLHAIVLEKLQHLASSGAWPREEDEISPYTILVRQMAPLHLDSAPVAVADFHIVAALGYDHRTHVAAASREWIVEAIAASFDAPNSKRASWRASACRQGGYTTLVGRLIGQLAAHAAVALRGSMPYSAAVRNEATVLTAAWKRLVDDDVYWATAVSGTIEREESTTLEDVDAPIQDFSTNILGSTVSLLAVIRRILVRLEAQGAVSPAHSFVRGCVAACEFFRCTLRLIASYGGDDGERVAATKVLAIANP